MYLERQVKPQRASNATRLTLVILARYIPIHEIFERSCEMGLFRLTADTVARIFGVRVHRRLRGKLSCVLDKFDHRHRVMRVYGKSLVARLYEKFSTFLRVEICVNRLKDLGLNKGLANLEAASHTRRRYRSAGRL